MIFLGVETNMKISSNLSFYFFISSRLHND